MQRDLSFTVSRSATVTGCAFSPFCEAASRVRSTLAYMSLVPCVLGSWELEAAQQTPLPASLIRDVVKARTGIPGGHLRVDIIERQGQGKDAVTHSHDAWIRGDKFVVWTDGPVRIADEGFVTRQKRWVNAWFGEKLYGATEFIAGASLDVNDSGALQRKLDFWPQDLGLTFAPSYDPWHMIGSEWLDLTNAIVEKVSLDGRDVWRISRCIYGNASKTVSIWVDGARGASVVRFELWNEKAGSKVVCENTIRDFGGTWFPQRSVVRRYKSGKLSREIEATVVSAEFGPDAAPESTFTLAGLGLVPGMRVPVDRASPFEPVVPRPGINVEAAVWDGETLIPEEVWRQRQTTLASSVSWKVPVAFCGLLGVLGAFVVGRWMKRAGL